MKGKDLPGLMYFWGKPVGNGCSCQPITTEHMSRKEEGLPGQMAPEAAGRGLAAARSCG